MKNFVSKIKDLFWRHKLLGIVVILSTILFLVLFFMVIWMTVSNVNSYGNRLDGIEEVNLENKFLKEQVTKLEENDQVSSASCRLQGKIVYFVIHFERGTDKKKAMEIATTTLDNFSDDEKGFYDFEYLLSEDAGEESSEDVSLFVITGTKQNKNDSISWSKN